jgi:hypothetical protein
MFVSRYTSFMGSGCSRFSCAAVLISMAWLPGNLHAEDKSKPRILTKWSDLKGVDGFEDLEGIDDPSILDDIENLEDLGQFKGLPGFDNLDGEEAPELDLELPTWDFETTLTGSMGYKDNILLRPIDGESSGFWRTDIEGMLWRYPDGKTEFVSMFGFTDVRYFSAEETDGEQTAFLYASFDWTTTNWLSLTLPGQVLYQDQVLDFSVTEAESVIGQVQVFSFSTNPEWNIAVNETLDIGVSGLFRSDSFENGPDDFQDVGGRLIVVYRLGLWGDIDLLYKHYRRDYATRVQYTAGGRPMIGTELMPRHRVAEGRFDVKFGPESELRIEAKGDYVENRGNGAGYFDYDRARVGLEFTWTPGPWRFRLLGSITRYEYLLQTVWIEDASQLETRMKDDRYVQFRIERRLSEGLWWHLDCEGEQSTTNDFYGSYDSTAAYSGMSWIF